MDYYILVKAGGSFQVDELSNGFNHQGEATDQSSRGMSSSVPLFRNPESFIQKKQQRQQQTNKHVRPPCF